MLLLARALLSFKGKLHDYQADEQCLIIINAT